MKLSFRLAGNITYLWIATEPVYKTLLGIHISESRNMLVTEKFIRSLVSKYGKHTVFILMVVFGILKPVRY